MVCQLCPLRAPRPATVHWQGIVALTTDLLPQVLGPWLTAVESIVTGQRSSLRHWYWVVMGMPKLTRLELGICLHHMHLDMLARLTQLTSLSLNMIEDSSINSEEEGLFVDPQGLHPLSALRQLRELRLTHSSVPNMPPGVSQLSNLLYLEFHTDWTTPASVILPSLTRLAQLQALVLRGDAVEMRTLSLDSGLSCLVNSRVLMVNSQTVLTHDFTNSFAAFHMSCLQVLDLSLPDGSRLPTHWLAPMHQLRVLAVCSNTLAGALPAHIVPLLNILIISVDYNIILPCTQPVLHVDTLPSVLDCMQSPQPLTIVCRRALIAGKMPAAQVRTLSSTGHFLVVSDRMPVKHIHQLVLRMLPPCLQQLCKQLRYLTIPCYLK